MNFVQDQGAGRGRNYSVNFPLRDGIDDESYENIFKPVSTSGACLMLNSSLCFFICRVMYYRTMNKSFLSNAFSNK